MIDTQKSELYQKIEAWGFEQLDTPGIKTIVESYERKVSTAEARIKELEALCDDFFLGYWEQEHSLVNQTCVYCSTTRMANGNGAHHSAECPVTRYQEIKRSRAALKGKE